MKKKRFFETQIVSIDRQRSVFESIGCIVEENEPDMTDANESFLNFRHWQYEAQYGDLLVSESVIYAIPRKDGS